MRVQIYAPVNLGYKTWLLSIIIKKINKKTKHNNNKKKYTPLFKPLGININIGLASVTFGFC